ncbi:HEAT repeat domain-containing protein [Candidatus Latescibacterota bacterium]
MAGLRLAKNWILAPVAALCVTAGCGDAPETPATEEAARDQKSETPAPATAEADVSEPPYHQQTSVASPASEAPDPASAAGEPAAKALAPAPLPRPAGPSADQDAASLTNADLPDSARRAAAQRLLLSGRSRLVTAYGSRNCVPIIRQLIEARVASRDTSILPLILDLFRARGGEERIDFEVYLLAFGGPVEGELVGLLGSSDVSLVLRAVDTLAKMKAVAAADTVASLLRHPDSWVRIGAAHALGEIAGPGAAAHLLPALQDTAYSVVNASLVALGGLRAPELYEPAMALATSDNPHVRKHAAIALGELGDARARETLQQLADGDSDSGVRFMARRAVKLLEEQQ